jgi:hypothetical protein
MSSAQDKTEQVLREIHILFSKSEVYDKETNRIIVDKKEVLELLSRLNTCIYQIMEEHELTKQSRDKAEREARKRGEDIVWDASRKAEDVYAASVMYTNEALQHVQQIMQQATDSVKEIYEKMNEELVDSQNLVRRDQSELKSHLEGLVDTEKYLKLIEERNKEIKKAKDKENGKEEKEPSPYAAIKPEIRVDKEYFKKAGIPLEDEAQEEEAAGKEADKETDKEAIAKEVVDEEKAAGDFTDGEDAQAKRVQAEINVNLDAEYFKWVEEGETPKEEKKPKKGGGFFKKFS